MKCRIVIDKIDGKKYLIPECGDVVNTFDISFCTCERDSIINDMDKEKITLLLNSGMINISELARQMYPNNKTAVNQLSQKVSGFGGRKLTDRDFKLINNIFTKYIS